MKPTRVLDIGCGTGEKTSKISQLARSEVIGIDVDYCALQNSAKNSQLSFLCCAGHQLPFRDSTFDAVVSFFTFHEYYPKSAIDKLVGEIRRVLVERGVLMIVDKFFDTGEEYRAGVLWEEIQHEVKRIAWGYDIWGLHTSEEYVSLLERNGFNVVTVDILDISRVITLEEFQKILENSKTMRVLEEIDDACVREAMTSKVRALLDIVKEQGYYRTTRLIFVEARRRAN